MTNEEKFFAGHWFDYGKEQAFKLRRFKQDKVTPGLDSINRGGTHYGMIESYAKDGVLVYTVFFGTLPKAGLYFDEMKFWNIQPPNL